ncbi:MAG: acyltransferase [Novosphingobium sp.]|nr:acyltransferase [Novosphingobium sp.]
MRYYWSLDLLRFISAVLVLFFHIAAFRGDAPGWPFGVGEAPLGWLYPFSWFGWIGVQIFFVLSGFIISASAYNSTALDFLKRRGIRVFPALWLSAALALAARAFWGEPLGELLPSFLRSIVLSPKGPYIDGVAWSLVVEAIFYAFIALVILIAPRFGGFQRSLTLAAYGLGIASTVFTLLVWLVINTSLFADQQQFLAFLRGFTFDLLLLRHGALFAVGILLYQTVERGASRYSSLGLVVFISASVVQIANNTQADLNALCPVLAWLAATCMIYLGAKYGDGAAGQSLRPVMRPIGLMTYPLYLNHFVLGQALVPLFALWISSSAMLFVVLLVTLLANAWLISQFPELWIQRYLRKVLFRQGAPRVAKTAMNKA